jgi:uncharacterized protein
MNKTNILPKPKTQNIALFWIISIGFSYLANIYIPKPIAQLFYPGLNVFSYGLGPTIGVLAIYLLSLIRKQPFKIIGFFGSGTWYKSVTVFVVPIISMTFLSGGNYLKSFLIGLSVLVYCVGEEIGWRGWLQTNLSHLKPNYSTLIVTTLWLFWHLSFQPISINFAVFLLLGSLGIGLATTKTQSILVAAAMHAIPNIIEYSPMSLFVTVPVWVIIFWSWKVNNRIDDNSFVA